MWGESLNIYNPAQDITDSINELENILNSMDIPEGRKDISKNHNLRWLQRNLAICNVNHPKFQTAMKLILWLLR